tara:strand:- start:72987 stop:73265 length:279 start_codon:yes stop_codon:yes gene_type:complete
MAYRNKKGPAFEKKPQGDIQLVDLPTQIANIIRDEGDFRVTFTGPHQVRRTLPINEVFIKDTNNKYRSPTDILVNLNQIKHDLGANDFYILN